MIKQITTENLLQLNKLLMERIGSIIGHRGTINTAIYYWLEEEWDIYENLRELYIKSNIDGEEYSYTISSYASLGKQLYWGTEGDLTFVMGYDDTNGNWEDVVILVLSTKNRIKSEQMEETPPKEVYTKEDVVSILEWIEDPTKHGYSKQMREAMIIYKKQTIEELVDYYFNNVKK